MQRTNPRNISEPLLPDEVPPGSHLQTYAPPPSQSSDMLDLHLTATTTDSKGQLIPMEEEEISDEDLPTLPPLVTYCFYVRFGCAFGKWIFVVLIVNVMAIQVNVKAGYFGYSRMWPLYTWHGYLLATVWFMTALWFYRCAKVVEKDLQKMDDNNYQPVRLLDEDISSPPLSSNYEHVYGQASRKLDAVFYSRNASTSSLINLSLVLGAVSLSAAVFLVTGLASGAQYHQTTCDFRIRRNGTSSNKTILADIETYPEDVQTWIVQQTDPWGSRYQMQQFNNNDDERNEEPVDDEIRHHHKANGHDAAYSFPTAHAIDYGIIAPMADGTVFLGGQPVGEIMGKRNYMVLVEIPGNGSPPKYHMDIRNPGMFIPVANTASKNENGNWVASQYCFTAYNEDQTERGNARRSSTSIIQTTSIYCVTAKERSTNGGADISQTKIAWTDKVHHGGNMNAASTGNEILVSRTGTDNFATLFQEVVMVNPTTMKSKVVYNRLSSPGGNVYYSLGHIETTRCIQDHVEGGSAMASMVVMVFSGYWLIVREGIPAGVAPILLSVVSLIRLLTYEWESGLARMSLTVGMLFFHGVLACGNVCHLPTWIGRGMYVWALYSWSISFIFIDWLFQMGGIGYMATVCLCLSGIVLNHPIPQVIGYSYVLMGIWSFILFPFFGYHGDMKEGFHDHLAYGTLHILAGIGIIGLSRCLSNNRRYFVAACRPISRAWRIIFYGGPSIKPRTSVV